MMQPTKIIIATAKSNFNYIACLLIPKQDVCECTNNIIFQGKKSNKNISQKQIQVS